MSKATRKTVKHLWKITIEKAFKLVKSSDMIEGFFIYGIDYIYPLVDEDEQSITKPGKLENINEDIDKLVSGSKCPCNFELCEHTGLFSPTPTYIIRINTKDIEIMD